jgi:hypothetical protein
LKKLTKVEEQILFNGTVFVVQPSDEVVHGARLQQRDQGEPHRGSAGQVQMRAPVLLRLRRTVARSCQVIKKHDLVVLFEVC